MTRIDDASAVDAIAALAAQAEQVEHLDLVEGRLAGLVLHQGQHLHQIDLDQYAPAPVRKTGSVAVEDADSLVTYVDRHKDQHGSTLWANLARGTVIVVLNDHFVGDGSAAGHGDHRATLTLPATPDWKHWLSQDSQLLGQTEFAEHLEDGATAIRVPDAATMMEIAQTFHATNGVAFKSSHRLQSGETQFKYEESVDARAGTAGTLQIPDVIVLGLQPFENGPTYEVSARFRYRITNGGLRLGYRLIRPDLAKRQAFTDILADISERTALPVLAGTPRS